ncbi:MAG: serine protease, partial [Gemmata sp.]
MRRKLFALLLLGSLASLTAGRPKSEPAPADAGASAYQRVIRSTAWVHSDRGAGKLATGTGTLVDRSRRLLLTNYHVVGDVRRATVYFPEFEGREAKRAIADRKHYQDRAGKLGIGGEVVELDKGADLALVRLDRVPEGIAELPLAADSPDPGQSVHSIGNPGKSGALWVYTPGKVRQVYTKKWKAKLDERSTVSFEAKVIETDSPTNPGDSGGPLANDRGELVGVTQGGALDAQSISIFVDLSEVKRLLNRRSVQALRAETVSPQKDPPKKEPARPREKALESKDEAKFFADGAWMRVAPVAEKLLKDKGIDLLVETVMVPPKGDADKVAAMKPAEREKFFKEYAEGRAAELRLNGVYVFASRKPATLYVHVSDPKDFPPG